MFLTSRTTQFMFPLAADAKIVKRIDSTTLSLESLGIHYYSVLPSSVGNIACRKQQNSYSSNPLIVLSTWEYEALYHTKPFFLNKLFTCGPMFSDTG